MQTSDNINTSELTGIIKKVTRKNEGDTTGYYFTASARRRFTKPLNYVTWLLNTSTAR